MQRLVLICLSVFALSISESRADTIYTAQDVAIFEKYVRTIGVSPDNNSQNIIIGTAKFFLDKPYVGGVLDDWGKEEALIVDLRQFDCTTFVENCLALYATMKSDTVSFAEYNRQLSALRYRGGHIDGYCSRLHYSRDWISENEKRGFWKNITDKLGGTKVEKPVGYMSSHPQLYKHLQDNKLLVRKIVDIERNINNRNDYFVIPTASIQTVSKDVKNGDIILFATSVRGLDYSHMGIAYWIQDKLHFIHASSRAKKVIIEPMTLDRYCRQSKTCTGISVLRAY